MKCKYIRTKDIIYKIDHINGFGIVFIYQHKLNIVYELSIKDSATGKQANTIEELCDVYVIIPKDKKSKPYTVDTLSVFDDFEDVLKHNDIYLSIWVGALLKPVAKLNDKGESCLI